MKLNLEEGWDLESATYRKVVADREVTVETRDGKSWSAEVRSYLENTSWVLLAEVRGLRDKTTALSVAKDLFDLSNTIYRKDCSR